MRYLSVCSGIEAATVAWHQMGWEPVAFSEIEKFPSAVLAHHYPAVSNLGDMTQYKEWNIDQIDLLAGGTPCQSFSVAGLRKGLDDPRGNLCLVYLGLAERFRPRWILWENVPGVLSSGGGGDFGSFLWALAELGYGWSYRILDAQYFGVPQRRRRVFVVGYLGDWRRAAAVLFERHSLSRDTPPSREKREKVAGTLTSSLGRRCGTPNGDAPADYLVCGTLNANGKAAGSATQQDAESGMLVLVPDGYGTLIARETGGGFEGAVCMAHGQGNAEIRSDGEPSLTCNHEAPIVAGFLPGQGSKAGSVGYEEQVAPTLRSGCDSYGVFCSEVSPCLGKESLSPTKSSSGQMVDFSIVQNAQVRRLTPKECERLQGFPDDYTKIPWRGKPAEQCPDGPRYKALGNSMAVPCMRWLGKRIQGVDEI